MSGHTAQGESLVDALRIQYRVITALYLREILTRYGRNNIGFLWLFIEPILFVLVIVGIWTLRGSHMSANIPIAAFCLTGYAPLILWRSMPSRCMGAISANASFLYYRQVRPIDIYITRILVEFVGATVSLIVLSTLFLYLGLIKCPVDPLMVLCGWMLLTFFGGAFAIVIGTLCERYELLEKIWPPIMFILFVFSGVMFAVDTMPVEFQHILLMFPLVHCVEMIRSGFLGPVLQWHYDPFYVIVCSLALLFFGILQIKVVSRKIIPT
jgi:ABC-2 type transport system permease protein/capsular polysaccharide transport system permease protein